MALQSITNINVDFYDKKYILINAKQLDRESRYLSITCHNHGDIYPINAGEHSAYIRYKKPDGYSVFNLCEINHKGKILVELTEQMLAVDGICVADLVIVNKGKAEVNPDAGEIVVVNGDAILSSMLLHIDVTESAVVNSEIESSYEYNAFNQTLKDYWGNFEDVMKTSKSWAVGNTGIREDEEFNNSMYWASEASGSAESASGSASSAASSASAANDSEEKAFEYKETAEDAADKAQSSQSAAAISETKAADSAKAAASSEGNAKTSETNAKTSEDNALSYKETVETINNSIVGSINTLASNGSIGSFIFMGAITFEELIALSGDRKATGYVYCVTDDFTTTDSFVNGAELSCAAGTNVYCCYDGMFNCLGGASSITATVDEVREYLSI